MAYTPENSYYCSTHIHVMPERLGARLASHSDGSHYLVIDIAHLTIFINDLEVAQEAMDRLWHECYSNLKQWEQAVEEQSIPDHDLVPV